MGIGASTYFWPHVQHSESDESRQRRLAELRAGAPESYFEEKRTLEAYPTRIDRLNRRTRLLGGVAFVVGLGGAALSFLG